MEAKKLFESKLEAIKVLEIIRQVGTNLPPERTENLFPQRLASNNKCCEPG